MEACIELDFNVLYRVYSKAVDAVVGYPCLDPGIVSFSQGGKSGFDIWQRVIGRAQIAKCELGDVVLIFDLTEGVEVAGGVERTDSGVVYRVNIPIKSCRRMSESVSLFTARK